MNKIAKDLNNFDEIFFIFFMTKVSYPLTPKELDFIETE